MAFSMPRGKTITGPVIAQELLTRDAHFYDQYRRYIIDEQEISSLSRIDESYEFVVLFGTWCHDSVREVPRLIKLFERGNKKLQLIGVNTNKEADEKYHLRFTPTLIVYQHGHEIGRIVEKPNQTWTVDILDVISQREN
ncbi:thioredoxin [Alteromonadales bacterium alter-6D02]|nr:thioredoxin [Alteromonadales bacterium alter-6D02]